MLLSRFNKFEISDQLYDNVLQYKQNGVVPQVSDNKVIKFRAFANKFDLENGKLLIGIKSVTLNSKNRKLQLIPPRERDNILKELYEDIKTSHNGRDSFYYQIISRYFEKICS